MGHRKYAALQEAAKQCEKTDPVRRSGRSTKRSQTVIDAIDDELQSCERAVTDAIDDELPSRKRAVADATDDWLPSRKQGRPPCPAATERRAAVVPPVKGSTMGYVGVYWDRSTRVWKAEYKPAKKARKKYLGSYATDQLAARARYDHIRDKGLEQFNTMDVLDTATDLMVPRERMLSFEVGEDAAAAQRAVAAARASLFGASLRSSVVDDIKEARDGGLMVWSKDGQRVIVLDPVVFVEAACKSVFRHNRWEIVEGQLRAYGFDCVARDSDTEVARLGWQHALEFKHPSFCRDGGLLEAKKCRPSSRTATGAARLRYVLETCGLPERFEVTNENARAIRDMFREKNGGSLTFKLDDTKVRLKVNLRGSLEFFEVKRKRAAATPAPSSPKRRRVLPVDAPQMQEALSDVLQKGTLPGVASLDGKGASLTSAAAVSQIRLAADAVDAASTLDMVATRYNTARDISASPPVAAKLGALPGGIEGDLTGILGQRDEINMILKKHTRDFENARYMLRHDEASSLIKVWSGHDVHTNLPAMVSLVSLDAATRVRLYRGTNDVSESGYVDVLPPDRDSIHNVPLLNPEEARCFCQDLCGAEDLFKAGPRDRDAKDLINELRARLLFEHLLEARLKQLKAIVRPKKRKRKGGYAAAAASLKRVRKELLDGETPLDPTTLKGLGPMKVERLAAVGIRTVEQLARVDITDRAFVEAVTRSRCFDVGATTLINWKGRAIAFLERKFSGRGGLLLNTARLAALREEYAREREQAAATV